MRVYVGTYAKYGSGSIKGAWLDLEDYGDRSEFFEACRELHSDEEEPECMFQDWEGIPSGMISEGHIDESCWELLEAYDRHGEGPVNAFCELFREWDEGEFNDRYRGEYSSWRAFAEDLLDGSGHLDELPEWAQNYFDYEAYARDLKYDFCEQDDHFFWNN